MPHKCSFCGEIKPVRKIIYLNTEGHHLTWFLHRVVSFDYICEPCDKAQEILMKQKIKEYESAEKKKYSDWIKQRDKILSRNKSKDLNTQKS